MTELQACELNILREVTAVCDRLQIPYYMVCGSALGAVRHQGFIPWDDDVDIGMFREDYERFLKEAPHMLPDHLFVQNFRTDKGFSQIYSKVRDNRTTYVEKSAANIEMHHGVYIDVFPLDGYPATAAKVKWLEIQKMIYKVIIESPYDFPRTPKVALVVKLLRGLRIHRHLQPWLKKYDWLISSYSTRESPLICNHGNWQGRLEYAPKEQYGNGLIVKFEGLDVRIPENYDDYLTQKYGDWRTKPPKELRKGHHEYSVMDLDKPYTEYRR